MKFKRFLISALLAFFGFSLATLATPTSEVMVTAVDTPNQVSIYYFTSPGCPHCASLKDYLALKQEEKPHLILREFDVMIQENEDYLYAVADAFDETNVSTPFTIIGGKHYVGFSSVTEAALNRIISKYESEEHVDVMAKILAGEPLLESDFDQSSDYEYEIPIIGTVDVREVSLGLIAIILGFLDGLNPCAMWVLLFLISLVLGSDNKKRIWLIGGFFLFTSAAFYFVLMMAWLQTIHFLVAKVAFQIIVGIFALLAGGYNLYSFIKAQVKKTDGCEVTTVTTKQKLVAKVRKIAMASYLPAAILGVIGLAIIVNAIELACSTGLPLIFTQILALNGFVGASSIGFILLYILFFILDDLIIFAIAVFTLKISPISTKIGKYAHLIGGILMIILGILMIFFPEILLFSFF
ncbi:MAG: hypothetical protein WCX47_04975 [Bacilli bacterium]|jgi:glutaredoxin|nr:hypothetical protein [Bacilli bacterium]